ECARPQISATPYVVAAAAIVDAMRISHCRRRPTGSAWKKRICCSLKERENRAIQDHADLLQILWSEVFVIADPVPQNVHHDEQAEIHGRQRDEEAAVMKGEQRPLRAVA